MRPLTRRSSRSTSRASRSARSSARRWVRASGQPATGWPAAAVACAWPPRPATAGGRARRATPAGAAEPGGDQGRRHLALEPGVVRGVRHRQAHLGDPGRRPPVRLAARMRVDLATRRLPTGFVMARTKETIAEPGAKTGVTRTFASCGTPVTVTDPCLATAAEVASTSVSVILAPSCTISTVARAVTARSGDETGAAASLIATGTGAQGRCRPRIPGTS